MDSWIPLRFLGFVCHSRCIASEQRLTVQLGISTSLFGKRSCPVILRKPGGILFREYYFGRENALSFSTNLETSAKISVSLDLQTHGNSQRGGSKTYRAIFFWGGGKGTIECPLQTQFWRTKKSDSSGLCPFPQRKMTGREQGGGETYHRWGGPKLFFGERFYGMSSPPLSSPPFVFSLG